MAVPLHALVPSTVAHVVMAYVVMAPLYRYGLYRYGLYSHGLHGHGCGLYIIYGVPLLALVPSTVAATYMQHIGSGNILVMSTY